MKKVKKTVQVKKKKFPNATVTSTTKKFMPMDKNSKAQAYVKRVGVKKA